MILSTIFVLVLIHSAGPMEFMCSWRLGRPPCCSIHSLKSANFVGLPCSVFWLHFCIRLMRSPSVVFSGCWICRLSLQNLMKVVFLPLVFFSGNVSVLIVFVHKKKGFPYIKFELQLWLGVPTYKKIYLCPPLQLVGRRRGNDGTGRWVVGGQEDGEGQDGLRRPPTAAYI